MDCYCDYDYLPTVYNATSPRARKSHKCDECGRQIEAGEQYENVFGVWDGKPGNWKTCVRCKAVRDFVTAHVPCCCWSHGIMLADCIETARGYSHEAPGLLFGTYRRYAMTRRARPKLGA